MREYLSTMKAPLNILLSSESIASVSMGISGASKNNPARAEVIALPFSLQITSTKVMIAPPPRRQSSGATACQSIGGRTNSGVEARRLPRTDAAFSIC